MCDKEGRKEVQRKHTSTKRGTHHTHHAHTNMHLLSLPAEHAQAYPVLTHPAQKLVSARRQSALPRSALSALCSIVLASFMPCVFRNLLRPLASHISVKPV